ncbi:AEC family transporter [Aquaspirillum serpens]|uniref:AEC family transporter n=1 Tax=Aquaspirillum serpens TaxID=190 RepID=UPI0003B455EA|nr:AEC family transporter [Aquaspirillum serpens]
MVLRILEILFPVLSIIAIGTLYGRFRRPDMLAANQLNMDLFVPALVFAALASKDFHVMAYLPLAAAATAVVLGSGLLAWPVARLLGLDWRTFVPPMMFNNTGNMGIPVMVLAFGSQWLPGAVIVFLVEMVLHFSLGLWMLDHKTKLLGLFKQPVIMATILGLVVSLGQIALPAPLQIALKMLGDISIPLMLFALGVRMAGISFADWKIGVIGGILCPLSGAVVAWLWLQAFPLPPMQEALLWVFAVLPPAVLNYLVAERYQQEPARVASIVLIGNSLSVFSLAIVLYLVLPH